MVTRTARAQWTGGVPDGTGSVALGSGVFEGAYGFRSRMGDGQGGSNPEELLGAAHAACFSMALSLALTQEGHPPESVRTQAQVHLEERNDGYVIPLIELHTHARVPGIEDTHFQALAVNAKSNCPVSRALAGVEIRLVARLD